MVWIYFKIVISIPIEVLIKYHLHEIASLSNDHYNYTNVLLIHKIVKKIKFHRPSVVNSCRGTWINKRSKLFVLRRFKINIEHQNTWNKAYILMIYYE